MVKQLSDTNFGQFIQENGLTMVSSMLGVVVEYGVERRGDVLLIRSLPPISPVRLNSMHLGVVTVLL